MNAAEAIQKISNLLGLQFRAENFATTKLKDGETEVTNNKDSDLAIGDVLYVVGETTLSPAPMGTHVTREGLAIYVDNESYIYKIEDVVAEEAVEAIEDEKVDMLTSATLADGTKIETDTPGEFTVGDKVYVVTEDGQRQPAPEGEHTTESGITITVDGEGVITGVKYPDEAGEGSLEDMKKEMEKMREAMSALLETVTSLNGKTRADIGELKEQFNQFKKSPDREPVLKKFSTNPSTNLDWKLELVRNSTRK